MMRSMLPFVGTSRLGSLFEATADVDRLLNGFLDRPRPAGAFLPLTIWEDNERVYIEGETPGAKIEDLELVFDDGALRIAYSRPVPEGERQYWLNERGYGRFERVVRLPDTVNADSIQAELNSGVLRVTLGKKPELQPRKIPVQAIESKVDVAEGTATE